MQVVTLPLPNGEKGTFHLHPSSILPPALQEKYPSISAREGTAIIKDTQYRAKITQSQQGISGWVYGGGQEIAIHSSPGDQTSFTVSPVMNTLDELASCGIKEAIVNELPDIQLQARSYSADSPLLQYRMALACTGEYARSIGTTKEAVLAKMVAALQVLNEIYERELSITFILIEENDKLIFLDPATDPYEDAKDAKMLLSTNTGILNQQISVNDYDIGHVFTLGCDDGIGGIAQLSSVCSNVKGNGVTCFASNNLVSIVTRVMAHEIGHQFSAQHTWSNCPPVLNDPDQASQLAPSSAIEPGSGSTIMSYAGACGSANIQTFVDNYFSIRSLEEMIYFSRGSRGGDCATAINIDNQSPSINFPYASGFFIPIATPFELKATATDPDGDSLLYCWEQYDTGPTSPLGMPIGNAPAFRSFPPTTQSNRIFPAIKNVIFDTPDKTEALPQTDRDFTFRCTVRDQHQGRSAVEWATLDFRATSTAGPFEVTYPTERNIQLTGGTQMEVLWEVANTSLPPVNCQMVDIFLSLDGGYTYPLLLAQNSPNDGRATVFLPDTTAPLARVKVAAADNIFFNISQYSFSISNATAPGFTASLLPESKLEVCLPATLPFDLLTSSVLGYQEPIQLSAEGTFPEGTLIQLTNHPVLPGTASQLQITPPDDVSGTFEGTIILQSGNLPTVELPFTYSTLSNNFDDLTLVHPANGSSDVEQNPTFEWDPSQNASSYQIQVSTQPQMEPLIIDREDLLSDTFLNNVPLESNQLFFWRLIPNNDCTPTLGTPLQAFHTLNNICESKTATDVPINISGTGLPEVISTINIPFDGVVNDVNIPLIKANYQPVNSLQVSLISPSGTAVTLFDRECGNTVNLAVGFDDQAGFPLECPPDDGIVFKPLNPLSVFKGENAKGDWKLKVKVARSGFGASGGLDAWQLEICASFEPQNPTLKINGKLGVRPGMRNTITRDFLLTTDPDNTSSEITYTLVTIPESGILSLKEVPLAIGNTFSQADIDQNLLRYQNTVMDATTDGFTFVVRDGTGGWIPITPFELVLDDNAVTNRLEEEWNPEWHIFPNPAEQGVFIHLKEPLEARTRLTVIDLLGRPITQLVLEKGVAGNIPLEMNRTLPSGKYTVGLFSDKGQSHKSFIILSN